MIPDESCVPKRQPLTSSSEAEDLSEEEDFEPQWVATLGDCAKVCEGLMKQEMLAVDIEGVDLGRSGEICIVQVADVSGRVFLFDVTTMGPSVFENGLKSLLEAPDIAKLFYDGRSDADALFHLHGVRIQHVMDMQVLFTKAKGNGSSHLAGMAKALGHVLPYSEAQRIKGIKIAGLSMFAPERGGSLEIWRKRPLPKVLETYCASDVIHMFAMFRSWESCLPRQALRAISEERAKQRIECASLASGPNPALVDFIFAADCYSADEPPSKRQRTDV